MTLTVGTRTFEITADTKIFNDGEPATLSDGMVGEPVRGTYKKTESRQAGSRDRAFRRQDRGKTKAGKFKRELTFAA